MNTNKERKPINKKLYIALIVCIVAAIAAILAVSLAVGLSGGSEPVEQPGGIVETPDDQNHKYETDKTD